MEVENLKYKDFPKIDLEYLRGLSNNKAIPSKMLERLLDYWEFRLSDERDPLYTQYFEYYIFFEAINSGIILLFIYDVENEKLIHQYGILSSTVPIIIQDLKRQKEDYGKFVEQDFEYQGHTYTLGKKYIIYERMEYLIGVMYPQPLENSKLIERLERVFLRYYLPESLHADSRFLDYFSSLNNHIINMVSPVLKEGRPVTFSYFNFESFAKYTKLTGESFATELVSNLVDEIKSLLKSEDMIFIINPREYLIVSLNCEKEVMESRFHRKIFQIKSLILNYRVRYTTWWIPIDDLSAIWKDISIADKRRN